jgi:cytochrome c oxidase subunit II
MAIVSRTFVLFSFLFFVPGARAALPTASAQETPSRRDVTIVAGERQFEPSRIEVTQNDLVRVTLKSDKEPRTFAVDAYRISKRVGGGQTITFEFLANQPGTFIFYCNLTSVEACKEMRGTLVVSPK